MNIGDRIKAARVEKGLTLEQLGKAAGIGKTTILRYETGVITNIPSDRIERIAEALSVSPAYLMGWGNDSITIVDNVQFYPIPIFESVSAGFGAHADSKILGYNMMPFKTKTEAEESMEIRVQGDSMFPKIEDGDSVIVRKVSSVDSGSLAVVMIDGEDGVVKKVTYGKDWVELQSINPMYKPVRFTGAEVQRIRIVGKVTKIIKEV